MCMWLASHPMTLGLEPKPWDDLQQTLSSWLVTWGRLWAKTTCLRTWEHENADSWAPLHLLNQNFRVGARNLYFGQVSQMIFMYLKDWDSALGHLIIFLGISFLVWKRGNYVLSLLWKKKSTWGKMLKVLHIFIKLIYMYVKLLHVLLSLQSWDQESLKHFSDWNTLKTGKRSECSHLEHVCLPSKRIYEWILPGKIKPEARSLSFLFNILHLMHSVSIIHWVPNMCQGTVPGWV